MTERDAYKAQSMLETRRKLTYELENIDTQRELVMGYISNNDPSRNISAYPIDSQGKEELKSFIKGQFNRQLNEIKDELKKLGIEP